MTGAAMAKRSKAKAKARYGKAAKKAKKTKKTFRKAKKTRKVKKSGRRSGPDLECFAEEQRVDEAAEEVKGIEKDLDDPNLSAEQRKKLEQALKRAEGRKKAAELALKRCRERHSP